MNFLKTGLAVVLGAVIGASGMALIRPQPVKAAGAPVYVDSIAGSAGTSANIHGSRVVGFACAGSGCFVLSE